MEVWRYGGKAFSLRPLREKVAEGRMRGSYGGIEVWMYEGKLVDNVLKVKEYFFLGKNVYLSKQN